MTHSHHHHRHHHHHHGPDRGSHPRQPLPLSLMRMGVPARLGGTAVIAAVLWLAILWALT
jgi:hypothetical protein